MKPSALAELAITAAGVPKNSPYFARLVQTITETIDAERQAVRIENNRLRAHWYDSEDAISFSQQLNTLLVRAWREDDQ